MNRIIKQRRARLVAGVAPQAAAALKPGALEITDLREFAVREPVSKNQYASG
jgi:hypothetical protein